MVWTTSTHCWAFRKAGAVSVNRQVNASSPLLQQEHTERREQSTSLSGRGGDGAAGNGTVPNTCSGSVGKVSQLKRSLASIEQILFNFKP